MVEQLKFERMPKCILGALVGLLAAYGLRSRIARLPSTGADSLFMTHQALSATKPGQPRM